MSTVVVSGGSAVAMAWDITGCKESCPIQWMTLCVQCCSVCGETWIKHDATKSWCLCLSKESEKHQIFTTKWPQTRDKMAKTRPSRQSFLLWCFTNPNGCVFAQIKNLWALWWFVFLLRICLPFWQDCPSLARLITHCACFDHCILHCYHLSAEMHNIVTEHTVQTHFVCFHLNVASVSWDAHQFRVHDLCHDLIFRVESPVKLHLCQVCWVQKWQMHFLVVHQGAINLSVCWQLHKGWTKKGSLAVHRFAECNWPGAFGSPTSHMISTGTLKSPTLHWWVLTFGCTGQMLLLHMANPQKQDVLMNTLQTVRIILSCCAHPWWLLCFNNSRSKKTSRQFSFLWAQGERKCFSSWVMTVAQDINFS